MKPQIAWYPSQGFRFSASGWGTEFAFLSGGQNLRINKFPGDADSADPAVQGYLSARADPPGRFGRRHPLKMLPEALHLESQTR